MKKHQIIVLVLLCCFFTLWLSPIESQNRPRKQRPCRKCFSVNFNDVDIHDWLKTMANLIQRNMLVDESIKGKITIISYEKVPESRALDFMKQVLELKGFGLIEEPNLIKIVNLKKASEASLPMKEDINIKSAGVISKVVTLPHTLDTTEMQNIYKSVAGANVTIVPYKATNTLILTGFARNVLRAIKIGSALIKEIEKNTLLAGTSSVHIYRARHITAESLAKVLTKLDSPSKSAGTKNRQRSKIRAVAHKESNSIVITSTPQEWRESLTIIQKLDTPRTQILLEVLIAEVSQNKTNDFGVDWRYFKNDGHAQFNTGIAAESGIIVPSATESPGIDPKRNTLNGFSLGFLDSKGDLLGILRANIFRENFNVLSSPQLLALNNQEAEINVGQDVPIQTRAQTSNEGGATTVSYEYKPAGIKLKLTPQINPSGHITIDFFAEISSIQGAGSVATGSNPTFSKRNIKTHVSVFNKQTIVIGGLISTQNTKSIRKVPILGDIPLLGYLFRRSTTQVTKRNLMIFMTPHMLQSRSQADHMTKLKHQEQKTYDKKLNKQMSVWPE